MCLALRQQVNSIPEPMFIWRAVSEEGSGVWLGEQARAFPCVAVLTEPEKPDYGMVLSLRIPRE